MKKQNIVFTFYIVFIIILQVQGFRKSPLLQQEFQTQANSNEQWFQNQILDHFNSKPLHQNWSQRYFVFDEYYDRQDGPLFLYLCGEEDCAPMTKENGYTATLCEQYKGIGINLEHRFYGKSQPFGYNRNSYSTENFRYLTHEQALEDIAYFILYLKDNQIAGIKQDTPVITVGGSYSGVLSAYFRYKYRHLTIGAYASSAGLQAIENFYQFDMQTGISLVRFGEWCPQYLRNINEYVEQQLNKSAQANLELKKQFQAQELSDMEFLEMFADITSLFVQYGHGEFLCNSVLKNKSTQEQVQELSKYAYYTPLYTIKYNQDTEYGHEKFMRQWSYQVCSQFGWFQTPYLKDPLRSLRLDLQYFKDKCVQIFGEGYTPNSGLTNELMGGFDMRVDNIIFTVGIEDQWQWSQFRKSEGDMKDYIVDCVGCGHCQDLYAPKENDPEQLKDVRKFVVQNIDTWLGEYRNNLRHQ